MNLEKTEPILKENEDSLNLIALKKFLDSNIFKIEKLSGKFVYDPFEDNYKYIEVINGEVFFDEFKTLGEVKLPEPKSKKQEEVDELVPSSFGLDIDDPIA